MTRVLLATLVATLLVAATAVAFSPSYEAANYEKIHERATTDYTPEFNVLLARESAANQAAAASIVATDGKATGHQYGRDFSGNLCANPGNGCAGDVRLYHWGEKGYGVVRPILFTARNGATLSGHVWMTSNGPSVRPGVVITNGSVQAPETLYWYAAQTLAKAGYVVMTWDPQGQGFSDTYGEGGDHYDGFPSQTGEPFYDGTEDALDFFFSSPSRPYVPRKSCSSGTSHADKQAARVRGGRSSAYNPFFNALDASRVGIAGHSLGASAVSYIGQLDPRVRAIVAWDNLRDVSAGGGSACASAPKTRPEKLTITKPALGMSNDYGLTPTPFTADPDPLEKSDGSLAASKAGVDSGQLNIRGGTHYEYSYIPNPAFGGTRRGMDMAAWYTLAWMDKYVKGDPSADARLLTTRWKQDGLEQEVDSQTPPDADLFSTYFRSRLDIAAAGGRFVCEDLRKGCAGMADDSLPPDFSFLKAAQTPDVQPQAPPSSTPAPQQPTGGSEPAGSTDTPPAASGQPAVNTISQSGGCRPSSRITRIRRSHGVYRFRGKAAPSPVCQTRVVDVRLIVKRAGHRTRRVGVSGTTSWHVSLRLKPGRYAIQARARALDNSVEAAKRGHRFRVR